LPHKDPIRRRAYHKKYARGWYRRNSKKHGASVKKNKVKMRAENRAIVIAAKSRPCADCHRTFHWICMDFDHLPGSKKVGCVSKLAYVAFKSVVRIEIAKCEVVCSNCHRLRTFTRGENAGHGTGTSTPPCAAVI
jgi:hypothetical protein